MCQHNVKQMAGSIQRLMMLIPHWYQMVATIMESVFKFAFSTVAVSSESGRLCAKSTYHASCMFFCILLPSPRMNEAEQTHVERSE